MGGNKGQCLHVQLASCCEEGVRLIVCLLLTFQLMSHRNLLMSIEFLVLATSIRCYRYVYMYTSFLFFSFFFVFPPFLHVLILCLFKFSYINIYKKNILRIKFLNSPYKHQVFFPMDLPSSVSCCIRVRVLVLVKKKYKCSVVY